MVCRLAVDLHHLPGSCDFDKEENAAEATNSSGLNTIQLPSPTLFLRTSTEKYGLKPDHPFEEYYASCQMAIMPENFFAEADKGKIALKRASRWLFWEGGVEFEDNTKLEADVSILATGYDGKSKLRSIVPEPYRSVLDFPSGMMPLCRGTIHPLIPIMAFLWRRCDANGWLDLWMNSLSSLVWRRCFNRQLKEMEIMKRTTRFYKRSSISTFSVNHSDEICEEMGWTSWRTKNWLAGAFSPYNSQDYEEK